MKYIFSIAFLCILVVKSVGQEKQEYCGTQTGYTDKDTSQVPWYGNNAILYEYLELHKDLILGIERAQERGEDPCVNEIKNPFSIPIRFYVWLASGEDQSVVSIADLQTFIDGVNQGFAANGFNIRFYMYCPIYKTDNDLVDLESDSGTNSLNSGGNFDNYALNVHIIRTSPGWSGMYNGFADNVTILRASSPVVLIHEIGHYFGLEHTHRFTEDPGCCKREPVTRGKKWAEPCLGCVFVGFPVYNRRCSRTGDYLCDTDADPRGPSADCVFNGTQTDGYGEHFHPDTRNYMSYYGSSCTDRFSTQQKAIILDGIRNWMYTVDGSIIDPDKYEPDDLDGTITGTPKLIMIGETQCHSMHNSLPASNNTCEDEADWLKIDNKNGFLGSYLVSIEDVPGKTNPVSDVKIWNTNAAGARTTEITTTMTSSNGIRTWSFNCSSVAPGTTTDFLVQVIKGSSFNDGGFYKVKLNTSVPQPTISGTNQVCIGMVYSLLNLPVGASVTWESSANVTFNTVSNGTAVTITSLNIPVQYGWISATINSGGCSYKTFHNFNSLGSTLPPIQDIYWTQYGEDCYPIFNFSIPSVPGATSYVWSCESPNPDFKGCESNGVEAQGFALHLQEGESCPITITVRAMDDCGHSVQKTLTVNYWAVDCDGNPLVGNGNDLDVRITPNPVTTSELSIEIVDNEHSGLDYQILITNQFGETKFITDTYDKMNLFSTYLMPEGMYYVHVVSENRVVSKSFIVQND